jgi:predicted  nucleic acid-binding Zn-ribbon protein
MDQLTVFLKILEIGGFLGAGAVSYARLMTKIKELDMKIIALEVRLQSVDKQDDKIMNKLDAISDKLNSIEVQLQNKEDRK